VYQHACFDARLTHGNGGELNVLGRDGRVGDDLGGIANIVVAKVTEKQTLQVATRIVLSTGGEGGVRQLPGCRGMRERHLVLLVHVEVADSHDNTFLLDCRGAVVKPDVRPGPVRRTD